MAMDMEAVGRVAITVHRDKPPTDEEWDRWVELCAQAALRPNGASLSSGTVVPGAA